MFQQLLTPVGGSLWLSFLAAILPIAIVFILLGVARRPAWQASLAGLVVGLVIAIVVWRFPIGLAFDAVLAGVVFAIWPVMWIVFNAIFLYNVSVTSGRFDAFRQWVLEFLPNDRRVVLVVIAFCFGALLEGIAGFGAPIAIASSLLILVGFSPIEALVFTLIFDTAPVAFGALGVPITVLGAVTHLKPVILGEMVGRQLPFIAAILPFYVIGVYGGLTAIAGVWPVLLVAGTSFGISQFVCSNYVNYALTDVLSSLGSLIVTLLFLRVWRPRPDAKYALGAALSPEPLAKGAKPVAPWGGWLPWLVVSAIVIVWTFLGIVKLGAQKIPWPGLDKAVSITLYKGAPYAAVWNFEPLATGTAILVAVLLTAALVGVRPAQLAACAALTWKQTRIAILTVALIIGLAYLMNYSGLNYTLGLAVSARIALRLPLAVPRLDRGVSLGQRYVGQRALRQSSSRRGEPTRARPRPLRREQLVGRRHGQDDLTAEHRDRSVGHGITRPRRRRLPEDVSAQYRLHRGHRNSRRTRAIRLPWSRPALMR